MILNDNELMQIKEVIRLASNNDEQALITYLESATLNELKMIQTVKYIGRDYITDIITLESIGNPEAYYIEQKKKIPFSQDIDREVYNLLGNCDLLKNCLTNGLEILGIKYKRT